MSDQTVNSAFTIGSYMNDQSKTYYTDQAKPKKPMPTTKNLKRVRGPDITWKKWVDEGKVTSLIMYASMNSTDAGANVRNLMKQGTAPIDDLDQVAFERDLNNHGFQQRINYVLVNFRKSGHSGGVHPALDTGQKGYDQIIDKVNIANLRAQVVPMGERLPENDAFPANLVNYWDWECCSEDREKQAGLLRYLNEHYTVIGAVGMRSGIMDMLAFAGIPIISIDISPAKPDHTSKGWQRGSKLERALGSRYGRSFIEHDRTDEEGSFNNADLATIEASVQTYFSGGDGLDAAYKDPSHPLSINKLDALVRKYTSLDPNIRGDHVHIEENDRTYMKKIKDLLKLDYTQVPNGDNYFNFIEGLLL